MSALCNSDCISRLVLAYKSACLSSVWADMAHPWLLIMLGDICYGGRSHRFTGTLPVYGDNALFKAGQQNCLS